MKNIRLAFTVIVLVISFPSTSNSTSTNERTDRFAVDSLAEAAVEVHTTKELEVKIDTSTLQGILTKVEESSFWGTVYLHLDVKGTRKSFQYDTYNAELNKKAEGLINTTVEITYIDQVTFEEIDLHHKGTSIHGQYSRVKSDEDKNKLEMVEGVLTATENDLSGDLPSEYIITKADGSKLKVTAFVDDRYLAKSGENVIAYCRASHQEKVVSVLKLADGDVEAHITFIREKFGIITGKMKSDDYRIIEFDQEIQEEFVKYKRAMDGDQIRFLSINTCTGHGCYKTSYYFWDDQLFFKYDENSHWVGQSDVVSESRSYYQNEKEIRCLTRKMSGSDGYDAVKEQLASKPHITLACESMFNRASINNLLTLTKETASSIY